MYTVRLKHAMQLHVHSARRVCALESSSSKVIVGNGGLKSKMILCTVTIGQFVVMIAFRQVRLNCESNDCKGQPLTIIIIIVFIFVTLLIVTVHVGKTHNLRILVISNHPTVWLVLSWMVT